MAINIDELRKQYSVNGRVDVSALSEEQLAELRNERIAQKNAQAAAEKAQAAKTRASADRTRIDNGKTGPNRPLSGSRDAGSGKFAGKIAEPDPAAVNRSRLNAEVEAQRVNADLEANRGLPRREGVVGSAAADRAAGRFDPDLPPPVYRAGTDQSARSRSSGGVIDKGLRAVGATGAADRRLDKQIDKGAARDVAVQEAAVDRNYKAALADKAEVTGIPREAGGAIDTARPELTSTQKANINSAQSKIDALENQKLQAKNVINTSKDPKFVETAKGVLVDADVRIAEQQQVIRDNKLGLREDAPLTQVQERVQRIMRDPVGAGDELVVAARNRVSSAESTLNAANTKVENLKKKVAVGGGRKAKAALKKAQNAATRARAAFDSVAAQAETAAAKVASAAASKLDEAAGAAKGTAEKIINDAPGNLDEGKKILGDAADNLSEKGKAKAAAGAGFVRRLRNKVFGGPAASAEVGAGEKEPPKKKGLARRAAGATVGLAAKPVKLAGKVGGRAILPVAAFDILTGYFSNIGKYGVVNANAMAAQEIAQLVKSIPSGIAHMVNEPGDAAKEAAFGTAEMFGDSFAKLTNSALDALEIATGESIREGKRWRVTNKDDLSSQDFWERMWSEFNPFQEGDDYTRPDNGDFYYEEPENTNAPRSPLSETPPPATGNDQAAGFTGPTQDFVQGIGTQAGGDRIVREQTGDEVPDDGSVRMEAGLRPGQFRITTPRGTGTIDASHAPAGPKSLPSPGGAEGFAKRFSDSVAEGAYRPVSEERRREGLADFERVKRGITAIRATSASRLGVPEQYLDAVRSGAMTPREANLAAAKQNIAGHGGGMTAADLQDYNIKAAQERDRQESHRTTQSAAGAVAIDRIATNFGASIDPENPEVGAERIRSFAPVFAPGIKFEQLTAPQQQGLVGELLLRDAIAAQSVGITNFWQEDASVAGMTPSGVSVIDFINEKGINGEVNPEDFEVLPEYAWLTANAAQFHFYLSYPKNHPTGIAFEPWHWHFEPSGKETPAPAK